MELPGKTRGQQTTTQKKNAKARQAAITDDETTDEDSIDYGSPEANTWVHKGQVLPVKKKKTSSAWLGKLKLECWLVLMRIFKDGNLVGLGMPAKTRIKECVC